MLDCWYEDSNRRQTYKKTVRCMCDWCPLVKTVCTYLLCWHVIGLQKKDGEEGLQLQHHQHLQLEKDNQ